MTPSYPPASGFSVTVTSRRGVEEKARRATRPSTSEVRNNSAHSPHTPYPHLPTHLILTLSCTITGLRTLVSLWLCLAMTAGPGICCHAGSSGGRFCSTQMGTLGTCLIGSVCWCWGRPRSEGGETMTPQLSLPEPVVCGGQRTTLGVWLCSLPC